MISIGLNLLLGVLLICALVLGVRLERRLRGLRQSHTDFAKAVGELDQAAVRTESSLAALRAGTEAAKSDLASRIDQARIACQRLEKLAADAERILDRPLPLSQPFTHHSALSQPIERAAPPSSAPQAFAHAPSAFARPEPELLRPAAPVQTRPSPAEPARSRAKLLDDDLFDHNPAPVARVYAAPAREPEFEAPDLDAWSDLDPMVGASPRAPETSAREAFYRGVLDRETFAPDPFASGRFAHERRTMLAAVMGGRR
jgi:hypothetical protein